MYTPYPVVKDTRCSSLRKWLLRGVAIDLLVIVGLLDYVTGRDFSFTLMYLAPIWVAIWYIGPISGLLLCFLAGTTGLVNELVAPIPLPAALWNAGVRLGVYVIFYAILNQLRDRQSRGVAIPDPRILNALGVTVVCATLIAAGVIQHSLPLIASDNIAIVSSSRDAPAAQGQLAELASIVQQSMKLSRPLLLGSRDPTGPSCIQISRAGDIHGVLPENKGDFDGGPGTSLAVLYSYDRQGVKSPLEDFRWHQARLRTYLENNITLGGAAEEAAHTSAECASRFLKYASTWTQLPADVTSIGFNAQDDWPSYCVTAIDKAIRDNDVDAAKYWATELAAATFWLEDLLRWRSFLYKNYLAALEFQARCESLFVAAEQEHAKYTPESSMSQFPAGVLGLNGKGNYYEIERQAERLFSMPADRLFALEQNKRVTENALWVPPSARELFLQLRLALSADNQKTWDMAARTPYQHSYLVNLLFRARTAELVDDLTAVLKKFDAHNRHATVNELMGVMMYRGHSFAGIEWGDRFQPQLTDAAAKIPASESDLQALEAAWEWTNHFYQTPAQYGVTFTLRDALEQKKLDCVRATDMIAAIFRNAGRTHIGHVRWCCETGGHSVSAYLGDLDQNAKKVLLADGLTAPGEPETWPDCYFHGHAWPAGLENNKPPYAMELYVRGLDSYVWVQGYIVRGPNAGWLTTAAIPYSKHFSNEAQQHVFAGPYPE